MAPPSLTPWRSSWHDGAHLDPVYDDRAFHVDLGCGTLCKAQIGIDRFDAPGVDIVMNLDDPNVRLPFDDSSVSSVISHHFFEHVGDGFIPLIDEVYRIIEPGGLFRAITPLFPSKAAVEDPDHRRYFMKDTWLSFCGHLGDDNNPTGCWTDSFSVPYTKSRFQLLDVDYTPVAPDEDVWDTARELRIALQAVK